MRRLRIALLGFLCLNLLWLKPAALRSQTTEPAAPEKVLNDMILALGGQAFMDVNDIRTTGRYFSFKRGELTGGDYYVDYLKFPDKERTELGVGLKQVVSINRGDVGWRIPAHKAPLAQPPDDTKEFLAALETSFDYVTRFVLDQPKTTLQNLGTDIVNFYRVDVIEIRDPAKNLIDYYIDRDSHLPVKVKVRRANESIIREELLNNWHRFGGMMVAVNVTHLSDGQKTMELHIETATFDIGMPDSLFADPKK